VTNSLGALDAIQTVVNLGKLETMQTIRADEVVIIPMLDTWMNGVSPEVQRGLVWWQLVSICVGRRLVGGLQAVSPLYDVEITIAATTAALRQLPLRVNNHTVRDQLNQAANDLSEGIEKGIAVCQFGYDVPDNT
jgi:hypothetical protein